MDENVGRLGEDGEDGGDGEGDCPYFVWHKVNFVVSSWYSPMFLI